VAPDAATTAAVLAAGKPGSVGIAAYYDRPVHRHPAYADMPVHGSLATTDDLAARALALPMANDLSQPELERVVSVVIGAARGVAAQR
jgi:dTDP-4-amino-4,6-dideoxygalactose transaminase